MGTTHSLRFIFNLSGGESGRPVKAAGILGWDVVSNLHVSVGSYMSFS